MEDFLKNFDLVPLDVVMIAIGGGLFAIFARLFGKKVIEPFVEVVKARERATVGAEGGAKDDLLRAEELEAEYERAISETRAEALQKRIERVLAAKEEGNRHIAEAQARAEKFTHAERESLAVKEKELRQRMLNDSEPLGDMIVDRVRATLLSAATFLVASVSLFPNMGYAAAPGGHGDHGLPPFGEFLSHLGAYWGNVLLYVLVLYVALRKPMARAFAARSLSVREQVQRAEQVAQTARQARERAESKIRALEEEKAKIKFDMERETEAEVNFVLKDATERAARVEKQARDLIEAEGRQLEKRLEKEIAALALQRAEERLRGEMTPEVDRKMREASLRKVEALVN